MRRPLRQRLPQPYKATLLLIAGVINISALDAWCFFFQIRPRAYILSSPTLTFAIPIALTALWLIGLLLFLPECLAEWRAWRMPTPAPHLSGNGIGETD